MRRRRLFRPRRLTGRLMRGGLEAAAVYALARANRLLEVGQHENAAAIFERLASQALDHGFERQAPYLFLQAGRARLLAGQTREGADNLREGLGWLDRQERWRALRAAGERVIEELSNLGKAPLADEIAAWLETKLPAPTEERPSPESPPPPKPRLPLQCPHCGAPARPTELEWLDRASAECAYCGGVIQT
jgi:hypothetical protein